MQTRLPARLAAPKLLSLAHVISLVQSGERGKQSGEGGGGSWLGLLVGLSMAGGMEPGVWVLLLVGAVARTYG